jgi:hypothetical protein
MNQVVQFASDFLRSQKSDSMNYDNIDFILGGPNVHVPHHNDACLRGFPAQRNDQQSPGAQLYYLVRDVGSRARSLAKRQPRGPIASGPAAMASQGRFDLRRYDD